MPSVSQRDGSPHLRDVRRGLDAARTHLLDRQADPGWWKGELRTNVTMDAEDLLLRQFLGILRADELEPAARWIRSQQRPDGTWATFAGGPGNNYATHGLAGLVGRLREEPEAVGLAPARGAAAYGTNSARRAPRSASSGTR